MSEDNQHTGPDDRPNVSLSRRSLLSKVALVGAAVAAGMSSKAAGQTQRPANGPGRGRIDVHHHFLSDAYVNAIGRDRIAAQSSSGTFRCGRRSCRLS